MTNSEHGTFPQRTFRTGEGRRVAFTFDGERVEGVAGETLVAALMSERGWTLRRTETRNDPRGMFCGMGVCQECLVHLEGVGLVRTCMTLLREGMVLRTPIPQDGVGYPID